MTKDIQIYNFSKTYIQLRIRKEFKSLINTNFMVLEKFFDTILGWAFNLSADSKNAILIGVIIISFLITLITTLVYKYFTDQNALKKIKEDNEALQQKMKEHKGDVSKMSELQKQAFQNGFIEPMKHQVKPLLITFIPFLLIFSWLRVKYAGSGDLVFGIGWFGTYVITSILFSIVLRKVLKVY